MTARDWETAAACATVGGGLWDDASGDDVIEAIAICAGCPVRQECRDEALDREGLAPAKYRAGIWGGLGPAERAHLARRRAEHQTT
jgi:WhiB family redox-sensing transcriptional regulator